MEHPLGLINGAVLTRGAGALVLEYVGIDVPKPYARNAKNHPERQIAKIMASMRECGNCNPILLGDGDVVIAGHGRLEAAKRLGQGQVPVIRLPHLTPAQEKQLRIADNKIAMNSGWNLELLTLELETLVELECDITLTGFETAEVDILFDGAAEKKADPQDSIPDVQGPVVVRPGDLWVLGEHRLLCADSRDPGSYEALLQGEKARTVFTDPPYNVPIKGHVSGLGSASHEEFACASGEMSEPEFVAFNVDWLNPTKAHCIDGAIAFVCMDALNSYQLLTAIRQAGLHHKATCTWAKTNAGMGSLYRQQCEFVHVLKVGTAPHVNNVELGRHGRNRTTLWSYAGANTFRKGRMQDLADHPTVKPTALVADAIKDCSKHRDIVLDPFGGSGTTIMAAERTGRRARVIELEPKYVQVSIRRWEALTGRNAVLASSGATFEQVARARAATPSSG